jgi:CDP-diacylglycerol--glycerol-3-phosphate 3-phosphatidyltransferase
VHHRGLRHRGADPHAGHVLERGGDGAGVLQPGRHLLEPFGEQGQGGGGPRPQPVEGPAEAGAPLAHGGHERVVTGHAASRQRTDALVEGDVDGVEGLGHLGRRPSVPGCGLPQPGPVEVHRGPPTPGPGHLGEQVVPRRQAPAEVTLGQLEQEGGDGLGHRLQVLEGHEPVGAAHRAADEPVQVGVRLQLVGVEVAHRVPQDRAARTRRRVHAQHRSLGHRPARQVDGSGAAEEGRHPGLQLGDDAAGAVGVRLDVGGDACQQLGRPDRAVGVDEGVTGVPAGPGLGIHRPILPPGPHPRRAAVRGPRRRPHYAGRTMLNRYARAFFTKVLGPVAALLVRLGISPDAVTVVGTLGVAAGALVFYPRGQFLAGTLVITLFVFADTLDGIMARSTGRSSSWGAYLDSTLDRVGDAAVFGGLVLWYAGHGDNPAMAALALACLILGSVVSYSKARAEGLGMTANVGIAERADRLVAVLVATGLTGLFDLPTLVLGVVLALLAVASLVTVVQRILTVRRQALGAT